MTVIDPSKKTSNLPPDADAPVVQKEKAPLKKTDLFSQSSSEGASRQVAARPRDLGHKIQMRSRQPIAAEQYQRLLKDPVFKRKGAAESGLHDHLSRRARSEGGGSFISNSHLRQMLQLRREVDDRRGFRQIIRHELREKRLNEAKNQRDSKETTASGKKKEGESGFETALKRKASGKSHIPAPPNGKAVRLPARSEAGWQAFFSNVATRGSAGEVVVRNAQAAADSLFRGLYRALANQKGLTVITDLKFIEGNKVQTEKFARILVENPSLLQLLEKMEPGDTLNHGLLEQLGEDLEYTRLSNTATGGREALTGQEALNQLKNPYNPLIFDRLQQSLIQERERRQAASHGRALGDDAPNQQEKEGFIPFYYGQRDPNPLNYSGKSKWWMILGTGVGILLLAIFAIWAFKQF